MTRARLLARKALRPILFAIGCLFLAIGLIGVVLPLLPGTIFLILATACFARSSPRFEAWLVTHPQLGPAIVGWRETGGISLKAKCIAVGGMALSFVLTWHLGAPAIALWATGLMMTAAAAYVATRPTIRP
jgi:uncharacterized membrane protein YbaN (DUF454 family)